MRFYEIASGVRIPVSEEEQAILDRAIEHGSLRQADLDERDGEVARKMVSRGLFDLDHDDQGEIYQPNSAADLWRW